MTLLLVILVLSALLSVSLAVFSIVLGEIRISGEIGDSFAALYAADQGVEQLLYDARVAGTVCPGTSSCSYGPVTVTLAHDACYTVRLNRTGRNTTIIATGQYRCSSSLAVKRAFQVTYAE